MRQCNVPMCKTAKNLHTVPFCNATRWKAWLDICKFFCKYSRRQLEDVRICELHFLPHFISNRRLTKDAIPTMNLPISNQNADLVYSDSKLQEITPLQSGTVLDFLPSTCDSVKCDKSIENEFLPQYNNKSRLTKDAIPILNLPIDNSSQNAGVLYSNSKLLEITPLQFAKVFDFQPSSNPHDSVKLDKSIKNDIYMEFKVLMNDIVIDAAKINITTLKILLVKALEIKSIITNYDEEIDDNNMNILQTDQNLADNLINQTLTMPLVDSESSEKIILLENKHRKMEIVDQSPYLLSPKVNLFSLEDSNVINKNYLVKYEIVRNNIYQENTKPDGNEHLKQSAKKVNRNDIQLSVFHTYKDCIAKRNPNMETIAIGSHCEPFVKTSTKRFKPNKESEIIEDIPKKVEPLKFIPVEIKIEENINIEEDKVNEEGIIEEKSKIIEMKIDTKKIKSTNKNQLVLGNVKTQNTQTSYTINPPRGSLNKPKVDKYVLKEQENDCNILILK